jgi:hypothetical protein
MPEEGFPLGSLKLVKMELNFFVCHVTSISSSVREDGHPPGKIIVRVTEDLCTNPGQDSLSQCVSALPHLGTNIQKLIW